MLWFSLTWVGTIPDLDYSFKFILANCYQTETEKQLKGLRGSIM
jgi:hypothetical protein